MPADSATDFRPTGRQVELAADGYRAVVTEVGAHLRELSRDGRPLIRGFAIDEIPPLYSGAVLAPWPNRLADGRYTREGITRQVPINEVDRGTALHGLVHDVPWSVREVTERTATLACRLWPTDGYPFLLDLQLRYLLDAAGLTIEMTAHNAGIQPAPYGFSMHPYLVAGPGAVDDWTLTLPADRVLEVDPDRLLPRGIRPVEDAGLAGTFDLRSGKALRDTLIDHAFTSISADAFGASSLQLLAADGGGVRMSWDRTTPWVQICTGDRPEPHLHRTGLAAEPMTCPPDAFNSGTDLVLLAPGEQHVTRIGIDQIVPAGRSRRRE